MSPFFDRSHQGFPISPIRETPLTPEQRANAITFGFQAINDAEDAMKRGDHAAAKRHTSDAVRCSKLLQLG